MLLPESGFDVIRDGWMRHDPLIGRHWCVVTPDISATHTAFGLELQARAEMILQRTPQGPVEVVHQGDQVLPVDSIIAKQLAGVGPVLLFDVGIVVFAVGS